MTPGEVQYAASLIAGSVVWLGFWVTGTLGLAVPIGISLLFLIIIGPR